MHIGFLVGKPEGKKPLGRTRCKWEDNIMMDLKEIWNCRQCVYVARTGTSGNTFIVNTKLNLLVP
jgi:hypothetical protein